MTIFLKIPHFQMCQKRPCHRRKKKVFIPRQLVSTETRLCHMFFLWLGCLKAQWAKMVVAGLAWPLHTGRFGQFIFNLSISPSQKPRNLPKIKKWVR